MERLFEKQNQMSGYFVKKPFPMHFNYIYTVYILAHMVVMHSGTKLEGCVWGGGMTPPKYKSSGLAGQIIWIGRAMRKDFK